ncbi:hypothetical protein AJ80_06717 [Polytolypa hystricis UAMH7299]|uniref:CASTOR ACT domain-containing protein n=1 Tax=Polytolypa hystricis (strain UAMH7299) TaxID=1447883 RepID=A0A2B7XTU7_POLH7|nr:hypothetical protein AJ80_06717 [Polytolypa hystricis UAMH7299]
MYFGFGELILSTCSYFDLLPHSPNSSISVSIPSPTTSLTFELGIQDDRLALIHIPLDLYPFFVQPILQLLFHEVPPIGDRCNCTHPDRHRDEDDEHADENNEINHFGDPAFLNISITPVECSVVCSRELADRYFASLAERFNQNAPAGASHVSISKDDYIAMQVDGQGLDAGQRVLELTSPLAMAGISIFFISTYFSDYILVPRRSRSHVTQALENRGFTFSVSADAFITNNPNPEYRSSPPGLTAQQLHHQNGYSLPHTPPPSTLSELQTRTFASLRKHNVRAVVDPSLRIVHCAAHYREPSRSATTPSILRPSLITALLLDNPRFLSLTLTATDPAASLLLEKRLLPRFTNYSEYPLCPYGGESDTTDTLLLGAKDDILVPIMLDLRDLPLEATGIVCGVASRLSAATSSSASNSVVIIRTDEQQHEGENGASSKIPHQEQQEYSSRLPADPDSSYADDAVEISFLSTARAGTVIVGERELEKAMASLDVESPPAMTTQEE